MSVYVIASGDTEFVKIGWAAVPEERLADLQCGHYEELRILRIIDCPASGERWLHKRFAPFHVRREWFRFMPEMLTIEPPQIDCSPKADTLARKIINLFPSQSALARTLGKPQTTVWEWANRGKIPSWHWMPIVAAAAQLTPPVHLQVEHFFGWKPLPEPERAP